MVKRGTFLVVALALVAGANGCASMSNTERGAVGGGVAGAAIGGLIGSDHGKTGTGAAIGGIIGTGIGALAGKSADVDEQREKEAAIAAAAPVRGPLSMDEIKTMSRAGTSDQIIINQIRTSGTRYNLDGNMIIDLQQSNVSPAVISEMQMTASRGVPPRTVVVHEPVYHYHPRPVVYAPYRPVYVPVRPPPPPRPGFSVGVGFYK